MKLNISLIKLIIFILILCIFFFYKGSNEYFLETDSTHLLRVNHYKFKSDEEYLRRTKEFNKGIGHMNGKLNNKKKNNNWKIKANSMENKEILVYLNNLKQFMNRPLKNVKLYSTDNKYKYFISVVVMFRYEDEYLEEWLYYYIMNGVDHFYMYSNNNTNKTIKILEPFRKKGYITLIEWNERNWCVEPSKRRIKWTNRFNLTSLQNCAFMDFNKKYINETKWLIKVDVDEFIYIRKNNGTIFIKDVLKNTNKKNIKIPRIDFGNNGHKKKPKGLIIENYLKSNKKTDEKKSIALTDFISKNDRGGAHYFILK